MKEFLRKGSLRLTLPLMQWLRRMPQQRLMFILAVVVGVLAAIAGHLLKQAIHAVQGVAESFTSISNVNWLYLVFPTIGITLTVLIVRYLVRDNISHGIARIFYAISRKKSRIKFHNTYSSVISSATTIGFGGSVGAEAPIVLTGAAIGSNLGQALRLRYNLITLLVGCGAAAAIAAVYKAPIAGFAFVLEVLMLELTFTSVVPLLIASVTAATVTYLMVGVEPFFGNYTPVFKLDNVLYYGALGVLGGVLSYFFTRATLWLERFFKRYRKAWKRVLIGGAVLGALIFVFPPLYGEGYTTISSLLSGESSEIFNHSLFYGISDHISTLLLYVVGILFFKVIATTVTNASGGVGGVFAPSLFFGAMMGYLFAVSCNYFFGTELPIGNFTLVGMAAIMSGVMKAPMTSMFLVAELTGGFQLFLPLMLASAVSFALSYYFEPYSIYTKQLAKRGELLTHNKDENTLQFLDISELIETDFVTVSHRGLLREMIGAVSSSRRNIFPVIDLSGKLRGVIMLDDIRSVMFYPEKWDVMRVTDFMSEPPERIVEGDDARVILEKFDGCGAWNLPVVSAEGLYLGFISKSRMLSSYREQLQRLSEN
ncbi:MAG: chloride channel protein [Rikenellaceae bacterium]